MPAHPRDQARPLPAKALIADALVFLDLAWSMGDARTSLAVADYMFGVRRVAECSQAAIAAKRRCAERRVREHLSVLCRRPDEPHDLQRHVFIRTYRAVVTDEAPRGTKRAVYRLAPEFERAVLAARNEPDGRPPLRSLDESCNEADEPRPVRSGNEADDLQPVGPAIEPDEMGRFDQGSARDRSGRLPPIEPDPRGSSEAVKEAGNDNGVRRTYAAHPDGQQAGHLPEPSTGDQAEIVRAEDARIGNGPGRPPNPIVDRPRVEGKVKALSLRIAQCTGRTPRAVEALASRWRGKTPRVDHLTQDALARTHLNLVAWAQELDNGLASDADPTFVRERGAAEKEADIVRPSVLVGALDAVALPTKHVVAPTEAA
jgi:hypothetical protein